MSASFEDMGIFHRIELSYDRGGGGLSALYRLLDKFVKNAHNVPIFTTKTNKKIQTVHNLITLSIVFTNKNLGVHHK